MPKDGLVCFECEAPAEHQHHLVPKSRGGTKTLPLCVPCHSLVHDHPLSTSQLVKDGIAKARAQGTPWGKKRRPEYDAAVTLFELGIRPAQAGRHLGLSKWAIMSIWKTYQRNK